jgi:hypothetical protein
MLSRLFFDDKAPYILTIFVASLAWTLVRSVDQLSGLPLIEYSVESETGAVTALEAKRIRLRNITLDKVFRCVKIVAAIQDGSKLKFSGNAPRSVTIRGNILVKPEVVEVLDSYAKIVLKNFPPGGDIEFALASSGKGDFQLLADSCADESGSEGDSSTGEQENKSATSKNRGGYAVLIEKSYRTVFMEHEMLFIWGVLALWALLIGIASWNSKAVRPAGAAGSEGS